MALPRMNAETSLYRPQDAYLAMEFLPAQRGPGVSPQACINSPCVTAPSGRFCLNIPIIGRKCISIPRLGSWRVRCCTKFFPPFFSCSINRC